MKHTKRMEKTDPNIRIVPQTRPLKGGFSFSSRLIGPLAGPHGSALCLVRGFRGPKAPAWLGPFPDAAPVVRGRARPRMGRCFGEAVVIRMENGTAPGLLRIGTTQVSLL